MPTLSDDHITGLLAPFYPNVSPLLATQLSTYLDLLLRWNARTNLTAIRDPEEIVTRHFGESLFAARYVPVSARSLLDLGSGAGFPGIPIQMALPALAVTLAESQNKKAAFLQEAVRTLGLPTVIHAGRAEGLRNTKCFDVVTMRAVDDPAAAEKLAQELLAPGGSILHLRARSSADPTPILSIPGRDSAVLRVHTP